MRRSDLFSQSQRFTRLNSGQAFQLEERHLQSTFNECASRSQAINFYTQEIQFERCGFALVDARLDKACRLQIDIIQILCDRQFTQSGQRFRVSAIHFAGKPPFTVGNFRLSRFQFSLGQFNSPPSLTAQFHRQCYSNGSFTLAC